MGCLTAIGISGPALPPIYPELHPYVRPASPVVAGSEVIPPSAAGDLAGNDPFTLSRLRVTDTLAAEDLARPRLAWPSWHNAR
jgi:hypothetical protein